MADELRKLFRQECALAVAFTVAGLAFVVGFAHWPGALLVGAGAWQAWEARRTLKRERRWRALEAELQAFLRDHEPREGP